MTLITTVAARSSLLLLLWTASFATAFTPIVPKSRSSRLSSSSPVDTDVTVQVGEEVGTGSYGTVRYCTLDGKRYIGKRPLTLQEVTHKADPSATPKDLEERAERCRYYWNVEEHCCTKLGENPQLPLLKGSYRDDQDNRWMLFEVVPASDDDESPAPSLTDLMALDQDKQHDKTHPHHLYHLQQALGLDDGQAEVSLGATLDVFLESLLQALRQVHSRRIVHRDIKPGNLLVSKRVHLIDFGSAADLQKSKSGFLAKKFVGLEDEHRVAVSPVYAAPELFVDVRNNPETFDVFSAALVYCQLLFNVLDERTDAGFHQQLAAAADWNLDVWLQRELASKVRPGGLEEALVVLGERPGLWRLLKEMFRVKAADRIDSAEALTQFRAILAKSDVETRSQEDGPFLESVLETFETCTVLEAAPIMTMEGFQAGISRPLHFVASFKRNTPLGLVLAEATAEDDDDEMDQASQRLWMEATQTAAPGQVFVKGVVPGGQADDFGIFEIGDQLQGVGELPLVERGFEKVVELLGKQPPSSKYVTLHFDRKKNNPMQETAAGSTAAESPIYPQDSGAWSAKGRRASQEDKFVLHEIQDTTGRSVLVAGVFDGHGGKAASKLAAEELPELVSGELFRNKNSPVGQVLEKSWATISQDYQQACNAESECIADYDAREGTLDANTGSAELIAGTTASVVALDESNGNVSILNCGDSRTLIVNREGSLIFQSRDHTPEQELERLKLGKEQGLDYSVPQCSVSRWWLSVGDYQYAVGRSLEGPFATSKGIISLPDMSTVQAEPGFSIVCASDGLWEVMDSGEVARVVAAVRSKGTSAGDAAKTICSMAIEKGTSDNVSAVIVYLQ